jgi:hypothetical protein
VVGQLFASRTAIRVLVAEIDKVLFAKATPCLNKLKEEMGKLALLIVAIIAARKSLPATRLELR